MAASEKESSILNTELVYKKKLSNLKKRRHVNGSRGRITVLFSSYLVTYVISYIVSDTLPYHRGFIGACWAVGPIHLLSHDGPRALLGPF